MRRSLALCLVVLAFVATNAFALGEGRLNGKITDAVTKEPIPNAVITFEAMEKKQFKDSVKGAANGDYAVFLLDATIKYKYTVTADGYVPYAETIKIPIGSSTRKDFVLTKVTDAAPVMTEAKADPSIEAYNAGAALANSGDHAGALAKFNEALKIKPDMTAAWIAVAKTELKLKDYPKAIEAANKVLEIDNEDTDMWSVLAQAYTATGDKAKAAEAKAKLPKSAGETFNDAARLINAGNDGEAEKLLKQAISIDDKFAIAYYELGMVYVRGGKSAEAKVNLEKYLELDPKGKDAPTAKEMLSYLK
jgi:tetratricopeptide (TPR) repeat protein